MSGSYGVACGSDGAASRRDGALFKTYAVIIVIADVFALIISYACITVTFDKLFHDDNDDELNNGNSERGVSS